MAPTEMLHRGGQMDIWGWHTKTKDWGRGRLTSKCNSKLHSVESGDFLLAFVDTTEWKHLESLKKPALQYQ